MRCERLIRRMSSTTIGVLHGTGALCGIIALFGIAAHAAETSAPSGSAAGAARPGQSVLVRLPEGETPVGMAAGTSGKSNDLVVARVHALNDDELVVLLPSGRLGNVNKRGATLTARPFEPASKDDLAKALTERGALRGFKTKQTKRFLYVYNSSDTFYIGTSRILETMYPGLLAYCKRQKLDVQEAELPLVVVMFRTQDEFNRFREMPEGVVAYYDGVTNWVIMYEMSRLAQVAPDIALKQAISTVAHEGVHQVLQNIGVQQRLSRWPMWISEGIAEYFAPTDATKEIRWKGVGQVNDLRMSELKQYALANGISSQTIHDTVSAPRLTSTGYASAWALTHFLAQKRPNEFLTFMQDVSQRKPLEQFTRQEDEELFTRHFKLPYDQMSALLFTHLKSLPFVDPLAQPRIIIVPKKTSGS